MNAYAKVMNILSRDELDWKILVFEIAKTRPGAAVKAAASLGITNPPASWEAAAAAYIKINEFIQAVKTVRAETGWGLLEAKKWCDDKKKELGLTGELGLTE